MIKTSMKSVCTYNQRLARSAASRDGMASTQRDHNISLSCN